jgi:hypothetical protein
MEIQKVISSLKCTYCIICQLNDYSQRTENGGTYHIELAVSTHD